VIESADASEALARAGRWDRAGVIVSAACAVHCTVLPFVAGLLPVLGLHHFADERLEWSIVAITAAIGVVGHTRAYVRHHGHAGPGLLFLVGIGTVVVIRLSRTEGVLEPIALGFGGLLAAAAHWANLRLCRCCGECATSASDGDPRTPSSQPPAA
jgi:hypothetical protein